jgi:uncharacterized protein YcbX
MIMNYWISQINIYPVKSLGGISLQTAKVTDRGLKYDRRWMVIDEDGMFLTQRTHPQMSLVKVILEDNNLTLTHKLNSTQQITFPVSQSDGKYIYVIVWDDSVKAFLVNKDIDDWLSVTLNMKCRLVFMPDETHRMVDSKYSQKNEIVSFAEAYPFLIIGEQSLNDLNSRLAEKLPMNRFRPNIVFSGGKSFDEDRWKKFKIGNVIFYAVKPCSRCVVTTVNQETAEKKDEPLKTLAAYRTQNNKVMFGQNLLHDGTGTIKIGDELEILEWK